MHSIAEELWLDCISEPGRVFYEKYIVVGFDGHIPSCAYVQGVIEYLGGNFCVFQRFLRDKIIGSLRSKTWASSKRRKYFF